MSEFEVSQPIICSPFGEPDKHWISKKAPHTHIVGLRAFMVVGGLRWPEPCPRFEPFSTSSFSGVRRAEPWCQKGATSVPPNPGRSRAAA